MSTKQFESKMKNLASDDNLIPKLLEIYNANLAFKDIMSSAFSDTDADKVFGKYKKRLERAFGYC